MDGRIINVGSGTGETLTIDGANLVYEGLPVSVNAGDTIVIKGGEYGMSWPNGAINIKNIHVDGWVKITSDGNVIANGSLHLTGTTPLKGVDIDFRTYDVEFIRSDDSLVVIDAAEVGGFENIKLRGFRIHLGSANYSGIFHRGRTVPYNNGLGTIALKGLEVHDVAITGACYLPVSIGGVVNSSEDVGYCEDIHIHDLHFSNSSAATYLNINNVEGFNIHDIDFKSVNINAPGLEIYHWRMIFAKGKGKIYNCFARDSGGCVAAIEAFSRTSGQTCSIYNCYNYNPWRYGTTEFRAYTDWIVSGITYDCTLEADFITYYRPSPVPGDVYSATCVDMYSNLAVPKKVNARNCVAVNPQNVTKVVNGEIGIDSNNLVVYNNLLTKFNLVTMTPASDSVLKGAGVLRPGVISDLYGTLRLNPPTIGAVEAAV